MNFGRRKRRDAGADVAETTAEEAVATGTAAGATRGGRKATSDTDAAEPVEVEGTDVDELDEADGDDESGEDADDEGAGDADDADEADDAPDEWAQLDDSRDWRDDGPFDIEEVDLEGDEVPRVDFGSLILTPEQGMQLQLQLDQATGAAQTALMLLGTSGLEVALFAAPRSGHMAREVRQQMIEQATEQGGDAGLQEGPFGTEVYRHIPVKAPDGTDAMHVSRTWLAEGPRWLLRGVLMGEAALPGNEDHAFVEFYKNVIVRRGDQPKPAGDLIAMTIPDEMRAGS